MCTIAICLPLTIYLTLPRYIYDEGQKFVTLKMESSKNEVFIDHPFAESTVPVYGNPKQLFILNKAYYYKIISKEEIKYFIVNPITGYVRQVSQDFWWISKG